MDSERDIEAEARAYLADLDARGIDGTKMKEGLDPGYKIVLGHRIKIKDKSEKDKVKSAEEIAAAKALFDSVDKIVAKDKVEPQDKIEMPKSCKVVLAGTIAKGLLAEVQHTLLEMSDTRPGGPDGVTFHNPVFKLVGFLANDDPAAKVYAEFCAKTCAEK
jgi:hypothetical protein